MVELRRIRFRGLPDRELVLVGDSLEGGGAIAREEDVIHGREAFAFLFECGTVRRHGEAIARREDLEDLGPIEVDPTEEAKAALAAGRWGGGGTDGT